MDPRQLRSFILQTVGQLKSALTTGSQSAPNVQVDNLMPDSGQDNLRQTSPFGLSSAPPAGVAAFFFGLFGSRFEKIALAFLDFNRPTPPGPGSTILYSTSPDGKTLAVQITLGNDGTLMFTGPTSIKISAPSVTLSGETTIALGDGGEATINGKTFITDYLLHTHTSQAPGVPTSPPISPPPAATYLSKTVTAKK